MRSRRMTRGRLLTWVILAFNLLMLLWLVVALAEAREECVGDLCRDTDELDSPVSAWLVIFIWVTGAVLLGVAWFVGHHDENRPRRHPRPR
ncbi:hypothetical protein AB0D34_31615 [Streptomyces sp. NPDC048420]|uniref:hypothetical protein n=1 Tax=Streptomyces sp. NPDC048420 TaxID=3155755 RepID=UPI0034459BFB